MNPIEDTVSAIAKIHAEHYRQAGPVQKAVAAATAALGRPGFVGVLTILVVGWIALNIGLQATGHEPPDPPPFAYLSGAVSLGALYLAAIILATQRHDDELASHREQLTVELAILSEQKAAKIIRLLEELRRSDPTQSDEMDVEAEAMATPADPQAVLDAIKSTHKELRDGL
jgi:uncharacterized membrane protein